MSVNKVTLLGRLGQDPELKYTTSGTAVCNMTIATSKKTKDKQGNEQTKTEWHRVIIWSKLAELCNQYLSKGRQAYIEGELCTRSYDDKDGKKVYITEIIAQNVQFIGGAERENRETKPTSTNQKQHQEKNKNLDVVFDDIPF